MRIKYVEKFKLDLLGEPQFNSEGLDHFVYGYVNLVLKLDRIYNVTLPLYEFINKPSNQNLYLIDGLYLNHIDINGTDIGNRIKEYYLNNKAIELVGMSQTLFTKEKEQLTQFNKSLDKLNEVTKLGKLFLIIKELTKEGEFSNGLICFNKPGYCVEVDPYSFSFKVKEEFSVNFLKKFDLIQTVYNVRLKTYSIFNKPTGESDYLHVDLLFIE